MVNDPKSGLCRECDRASEVGSVYCHWHALYAEVPPDLPEPWDDGRWDDDPNPYLGTYSEE